MAKNTFLSFSTTAGDNTDVGGIGILGSNSVSNFDNAFRTLMAILRGDLDNGVVFVTKATGYTAVAGDNNAFYEFTATATLSLTAAATLAADWHMIVFANGGVVTVDPDAGELINGASTLTIANGSAAYIICTGTAFSAITISSPSSAETLTNKTLTTPTLTLKQSASPTPTAEGDIQWDTDDNAIVVGDGAGQKIFRANNWETIQLLSFTNVASVVVTDLAAFRTIKLTGTIRPEINNSDLRMHVSSDNGASYLTGGSDYSYLPAINVNGIYTAVSATIASAIIFGPANSNAISSFVEIGLADFNINKGAKVALIETAYTDGTPASAVGTINAGIVAGAYNAFRLLSGAGNITGHVLVEGIRG